MGGDETAPEQRRGSERARDWSERRKADFLDHLAWSVNVRASCRAVRMIAAGLQPVSAADAREGDILLLGTGAAQWHLAVRTKAGFIHADAHLRRVVEVPGRPAWPVVSIWRTKGDE